MKVAGTLISGARWHGLKLRPGSGTGTVAVCLYDAAVSGERPGVS